MNREEIKRLALQMQEADPRKNVSFLKRCLCHDKPAAYPYGGWYSHCICKKTNQEVPGYGTITRPGEKFSTLVIFNSNLSPRGRSAVSRWKIGIKRKEKRNENRRN